MLLLQLVTILRLLLHNDNLVCNLHWHSDLDCTRNILCILLITIGLGLQNQAMQSHHYTHDLQVILYASKCLMLNLRSNTDDVLKVANYTNKASADELWSAMQDYLRRPHAITDRSGGRVWCRVCCHGRSWGWRPSPLVQ